MPERLKYNPQIDTLHQRVMSGIGSVEVGAGAQLLAATWQYDDGRQTFAFELNVPRGGLRSKLGPVLVRRELMVVQPYVDRQLYRDARVIDYSPNRQGQIQRARDEWPGADDSDVVNPEEIFAEEVWEKAKLAGDDTPHPSDYATILSELENGSSNPTRHGLNG